MALKDKATKSTSKGSLAQKAKAKGLGGLDDERKASPAPEEAKQPMPAMPSSFNQAPPPPAPLLYLRMFSQIPSLRKNGSV